MAITRRGFALFLLGSLPVAPTAALARSSARRRRARRRREQERLRAEKEGHAKLHKEWCEKYKHWQVESCGNDLKPAVDKSTTKPQKP